MVTAKIFCLFCREYHDRKVIDGLPEDCPCRKQPNLFPYEDKQITIVEIYGQQEIK